MQEGLDFLISNLFFYTKNIQQKLKKFITDLREVKQFLLIGLFGKNPWNLAFFSLKCELYLEDNQCVFKHLHAGIVNVNELVAEK